MSEIRNDEPSLRESPRDRAWATRRQKYGALGHCGSYSRRRLAVRNADLARDEISVARRHLQLLLPDEAAHKAITALDRADDYLAEVAPDGERDGSSQGANHA